MKMFLAVALLVLSVHATGSDQRLSKDDIIRFAKAQAKSFCHSVLHGQFTKVGCEFSATFHDNSWSVLAIPRIENGKGERVAASDVERFYIFSPTGRLLKQFNAE